MSENEVLVVVSKIKGYIKERSGMNSSDAIMGLVSNKIRQILDAAIENAKQDGRKTVMDRDVV